MKGYLQSKDRAKDRLCIGPDELSVMQGPESTSAQIPLVGSYSVIAGERVLFYRWRGELWLRFGSTHPISLQRVKADWSVESGQVDFKLKSDNTTVVARKYPVSRELVDLDQDPTPFVEAEDFDFLLFVRNVLSDSERADRIYRT